MAQPEHVSCLVLAAGSSRRFGSNKLTHVLPDGRSVLAASMACYKTIFSDVYVVLRDANSDVARLARQASVTIVVNTHAAAGMSQSIVAGVRAAQPQAGWLIALGDMPYVQRATLADIAAKLKPDRIVVPVSERGAGNPVAFGCDYRADLLGLIGDAGAKSIIQAHSRNVVHVPTEDLGIHHDIDVPADITP